MKYKIVNYKSQIWEEKFWPAPVLHPTCLRNERCGGRQPAGELITGQGRKSD